MSLWQTVIASLQTKIARWKIVQEISLKVRCGDCGERWKMKISLHGVGMIHIFQTSNQHVKVLQIPKNQLKILFELIVYHARMEK